MADPPHHSGVLDRLALHCQLLESLFSRGRYDFAVLDYGFFIKAADSPRKVGCFFQADFRCESCEVLEFPRAARFIANTAILTAGGVT